MTCRAVWFSPPRSRPDPALHAQGDVDDLQAGVAVQPRLTEQHQEEQVVGDAHGEIPDIPPNHQVHAGRAGDEAQRFGQAVGRPFLPGGQNQSSAQQAA